MVFDRIIFSSALSSHLDILQIFMLILRRSEEWNYLPDWEEREMKMREKTKRQILHFCGYSLPWALLKLGLHTKCLVSKSSRNTGNMHTPLCLAISLVVNSWVRKMSQRAFLFFSSPFNFCYVAPFMICNEIPSLLLGLKRDQMFLLEPYELWECTGIFDIIFTISCILGK